MTEEEFKLFVSLTKENFNINPIYITIAGGIKEGFFLTQLIFLWRHHDYQPFCKLDDYFKEKYKFTKWDLTEGRKKLITLGILTTEKRPDGVLSYEIHVDKLIKMLKESTASSGKPTTPHREHRPPLIGKTDVPLFNDLENDNNNKGCSLLEALIKEGMSPEESELTVAVHGEEYCRGLLKYLNDYPKVIKDRLSMLRKGFKEKWSISKQKVPLRAHVTVEETQHYISAFDKAHARKSNRPLVDLKLVADTLRSNK